MVVVVEGQESEVGERAEGGRDDVVDVVDV